MPLGRQHWVEQSIINHKEETVTDRLIRAVAGCNLPIQAGSGLAPVCEPAVFVDGRFTCHSAYNTHTCDTGNFPVQCMEWQTNSKRYAQAVATATTGDHDLPSTAASCSLDVLSAWKWKQDIDSTITHMRAVPAPVSVTYKPACRRPAQQCPKQSTHPHPPEPNIPNHAAHPRLWQAPAWPLDTLGIYAWVRQVGAMYSFPYLILATAAAAPLFCPPCLQLWYMVNLTKEKKTCTRSSPHT